MQPDPLGVAGVAVRQLYPIIRNNLVDLLVSTANAGLIVPFVKRTVTDVAAATQITVTVRVTTETIFIPTEIDLFASSHNADVTTSLKIDQNPATFVDIPLSVDLAFAGNFFLPVRDKAVFVYVNPSATDITFTADLKGVSIRLAFFNEYIAPIIKAQFEETKRLGVGL